MASPINGGEYQVTGRIDNPRPACQQSSCQGVFLAKHRLGKTVVQGRIRARRLGAWGDMSKDGAGSE